MKKTVKSFKKIRSTARSAAWGAAMAAAALAFLGVNALAGGFTRGNLVVLQDGDAVEALSSSGDELFLVQFTTSGALVSSNAIPTNGPTALMDSGSAGSEGALTSSADGSKVVVAGYNINYGYTVTNSSLPSSGPAQIPRALATVDSSGNYSLGATTSTAFNQNNIRSGTTDGNGNFWAAGANSGINYFGTGTPAAITGTVLNSRVIQAIGGNLYYSTGSGATRGIYKISGLPTSGQAATNIVIPTGLAPLGSASSPYGFAFDPAMTVCYVADSNNYTNSGTLGGVEKWTNNGSGTFVFAYTLQPGPAGNSSGAVGLAVSFGATTNIYGTLANATNIFEITDTGSASAGTVIFTASPTVALRGMAWAPTNTVLPPVITGITPASVITNAGAAATFTVSATGGPPLGYYWYFETATSTNLITGATGPALSLANLVGANSGNYQVVVSNASLLSVTSSVVSLAVGSFIVVQEGDGVEPLAASGTEIFLNQYTASGILVSSQAIPTNGPSALIDVGNSITEGMVSLATNGQELVLAGYNINYGYTNQPSPVTNALPASAGSAQIPRAVATVDSSGNYVLGPKTSTVFNQSNIRSGASDGNGNFWAAGANSGINYLGDGPAATITGTVLNSRVIQDIGGNLYYSTGSDKRGIIEIAGQPTTGPVATNYVIPTGTYFNSTAPSPYGFAFDPAMTVCYVADSNNYTNSTTIGGVEKWTNNGSGTFVFAYTLRPGPLGNTNGGVGLIANFGSTTNIYGTLANGTNIFEITDTGPSSVGTLLVIANPTVALRGVCWAPTNAVTPAAPTITAITPTNLTANVGTTATFSLTENPGFPAGSITWYKIANSATNSISAATASTLTLSNVQVTDSASYYAILANAYGSATSGIASLTVIAKPTISGISPLSVTTGAGQTVTFTLTSTPGTPPASNFWYKITGTAPALSTNLVSGANSTTLTLNNVLAPSTGSYFAILTNASGSATSALASLTVTGDPSIASQPANTYGLLDGTIYFSAGVIGSAPAYQWYYSDGTGNILAPVNDGATTLSGVAVVSGATSSTLSVANLQFADLNGLTNLVLVVTNIYGGAVTSSPASLLGINTSGSVLAFWDFNGPEFTNFAANPNCISFPTPYLGAGAAQAVGSSYKPPVVISLATEADNTDYSPFSGSVDNNDGAGFEAYPAYVYPPGFPPHTPPFSWGTDQYPLTGSNKQNGVQFYVSTVGAKNIRLSYESRVSATASDYERVQYTTNGTDWTDYPTSSTFGGIGTTYLSYSNDFTGFPGVANNPNFGVRVVTEYESTATYGVGTTNTYVGTANSYGTGGTVTYDVVTFFGDAITNNNEPPLVGGFIDTNTVDYIPVTNNFTVSDDTTPPDELTYSAVSLNPSTVSPTFTFTGSGPNRTLVITPNAITASVAAAPILVTVTDTNGDSTVISFLLTLTSSNLPPTNSLTSIKATNTLANTALTIPFTVGDDHTPVASLTDFSVASDNNTVIPSTNIVIGNIGTTNPTVTITPGLNQLGVGLISVTLSDDDVLEPKSTTATIPFTVRPNTNVIAIDYFDYDNSGSLDSVSAGFWNHLSGNFGQMKVGLNPNAPDTVTVDATANTENLQTSLLGAPYKTNSGAILYASYTLDMTDPTMLPAGNGTYITTFNDGSGNTADVEACLVVSTNNATPGYYRAGIGNVVGATALTSVQFPIDLAPGTNYVIVTALSLTNGFSTLWVNPGNQSSPSVTDTTPTSRYNIVNFELRESGQPNGGFASIGSLKVGTTFDAVFPSLRIQTVGTNAILNWSDPTLGIQTTPDLLIPFVDVTNATPPYTNGTSANGSLFFRFGR